jgi:small conductance mechanosensitive channel
MSWTTLAMRLIPTLAAEDGAYFERYGLPAIKALAILIVAWLVSSLVGTLVERSCTKARVEITLGRFFGKAAKWAILVAALVTVLSVFGVQTTSFAAVIGASVLAIGLAFQGTLGNFAAGIMLLIFRPFKVDDVVTVNGVTGKVQAIDLFNTVMDTFDNQRIIVPNGSVFGSTITNINFHPTRRVDVSVGTVYAADLDQVREVLMSAARSIGEGLSDPEPAIVLLELGDSSINWSVRVWVNTPDYWPVRDALTRAVKRHLDDAGIGIPFPQMDVHVDGKMG